jgi:tripartite ATP-independent transporter DctP family solute receptor
MSRSTLVRSLGAACALGETLVAAGRPAKAATYEFRCGSVEPLDHPTTVRGRQMWAAIERESGGRLRVQFFPNATLGSEGSMLTQTRAGALQFMLVSSATLQSVVPPAGITDVGFMYRDPAQAMSIFTGQLGDYIRREIAAKNLRAVRGMWDGQMKEITSGTHPIRTPDDMVGFKIRIPEARLTVSLFRALGASPTPMAFNELYMAMQTKLVEGGDTPLTTFAAARLYEVQKYVSLTNDGWSAFWLIANGDVWSSLPSDLQDIVDRNGEKYAALNHHDCDVTTGPLMDKLKRLGIMFTYPDIPAFRARLSPYYADCLSVFGATEWQLLQRVTGTKA